VFHQTFEPRDLLNILVLFVLEGILSVDNAVVLGILARRMPESQRSRALSYGLGGAFIFRLIAVIAANWLLRVGWLRVIGGAYLLYITGKYFFGKSRKHTLHCTDPDAPPHGKAVSFWYDVATIELTDIAFALDSVLAAIALVSGEQPSEYWRIHPKLWVIMTGGMLGVIMVRFAAAGVVRLLDRMPRLEPAAHLLILLVALKLLFDWGLNTPGRKPHLDFHSPHHWAFWVFWSAMFIVLAIGLIPKRNKPSKDEPVEREMLIR
jgi:YkoY family integral membrane protein